MMLQADSQRFAIARLCAQVPGASSASRRSSGRPRSESSSSVRSVVIRVADSATGITIIASEALAGAISTPSEALATMVHGGPSLIQPDGDRGQHSRAREHPDRQVEMSTPTNHPDRRPPRPRRPPAPKNKDVAAPAAPTARPAARPG